ncbi:phospho-N-acetylmuramoyl-pentapeptide-transferase [Synergistaceae bacterium OttesenSCG-928-I11]|nr:phospho-N-acetylmuramoyl-pentapeptide-transferase [Synergistaceae bacterium OttesenSCG-928-I11]
MKVLCLSLAFFSLALFGQRLWIRWMLRYSLGEAIKEYGPKGHLKKRGTPSMGGVVALFLVPFLVILLYVLGMASFGSLVKIWAFPVAAAMVGLVDDGLKRWTRSSEGLKSLQKLFLQILITLPWAYYMARGGLYLTPSWSVGPEIGIALLAFFGVGFMNAVNVTDGLDGLASGAVAISFVAFLFLAKSDAASASAAVALAMVLAFLWHNAHPAEVFMGDVGAHLWAGLILSLCVAERALILIFPLGFLFGVEIVTVAIQIVSIRKFQRKIFLMSPLHHHFELLGWNETKIVARFWLVHLVGLAILLIFLFTITGRSVWNVG